MPIPIKNLKYCHICKVEFDNYIAHINDKMHKDKANKYSYLLNNINNIFKRVNTFLKNEKDNKEKGERKI